MASLVILVLAAICVACEARIATEKRVKYVTVGKISDELRNNTLSEQLNSPTVKRYSSRVPSNIQTIQPTIRREGVNRRPKSTISRHKFGSNYRDPANVKTKFSELPRFLYGYKIHYPMVSTVTEKQAPEVKAEPVANTVDEIKDRADVDYYQKRRHEMFVPYQPPLYHYKVTTHRPNYRIRLEPQSYYPVHKPSAAESEEVFNKHGPPYGALPEAPKPKPTKVPSKKFYPPTPDSVEAYPPPKRPLSTQPTRTESPPPKVLRVKPTVKKQPPVPQQQSEEVYNKNGPPYGALPGLAPATSTKDTFTVKVASSNERSPPKKYVTPKTPTNSRPRPISQPIPSNYTNHSPEIPDGRKLSPKQRPHRPVESRSLPTVTEKSEVTDLQQTTPANRLRANDFKYFQDIYMAQLAPKKVEFGHVAETPDGWEERFERQDHEANRHQGKVKWADKNGGFGEHFWDLNHVKADAGENDTHK